MKEMEGAQVNGKMLHDYELEELRLLECPSYPKQSTEFSAITIEFPLACFTETETSTSKILIGSHPRPQRSKANSQHTRAHAAQQQNE